MSEGCEGVREEVGNEDTSASKNVKKKLGLPFIFNHLTLFLYNLDKVIVLLYSKLKIRTLSTACGNYVDSFLCLLKQVSKKKVNIILLKKENKH